jgi:aminopeptidase N
MMKPTATRRRFSGVWDQMDYLYDKAAYWLHYRKERGHAARYIRRLKPLVEKADPGHEAILGAACRALLADFEGDLSKEIYFTKHKLQLLEHLLNGHEERLGYDWNDVIDEYEVLAALYEEDGQLAAAREAKNACVRIRKRIASAGNAVARRRSKAS